MAGWILRHAGRVVLRIVLDVEALACRGSICKLCWALGVVTQRREGVATLAAGEGG